MRHAGCAPRSAVVATSPLRAAASVGLIALGAGLLAPVALALEVQVPLDRSGRIQQIDARLAGRLGMLLDRYPGFAEARLFRAPDSTFVLEVTMVRGGQLMRERVPLSASGADSLRERVSARIAENVPEAALNQEGRVRLLRTSILLGLGFYGWALPVAAEVDDGQTFAGVYLLTAGASFFLPFAATEGQPVTNGMMDLATYGATRGIVHGILVHDLAVGPEGRFEGAIASGLVASAVEGLGGYLWARGTNLSSGSATAIGTLGDWGLLEGLGFATLADHYDHDRPAEAAAMMLAGAAAGLVAGSALASRRDFSYGDARVMNNAGVLGAFASVMVVDWFQPEDHAYTTAAMVGGTLGLAVGDRLVRDTEFTTDQSVLVSLGTVAGAAIGLGVGYVSTGSGGNNDTFLLTSSMLGAALGFTATYRSFLPAARAARAGHSSLGIEVSPLAAMAIGAGSRGAGGRAGVPLVRVSLRF